MYRPRGGGAGTLAAQRRLSAAAVASSLAPATAALATTAASLSAPTLDSAFKADETASDVDDEAFAAVGDHDLTVTLVHRQSLSIPYRVPKNGDSVSTRQLETMPSFTVMTFVPGSPNDLLFAGRHNGAVVMWRVPSTHRRFGATSAQAAACFTDHLQVGTHKGNVTAIAFCETPRDRLLLTGSSDCTMKLWDPFGGEVPGRGRCVQTVLAHEATVTAIAVHCNLIISGSADKTLKVWKFDEGRELLAFPWLSVKQVFVFDAWITALWASPRKIAETSQGEIFAGDAAGNLTVLRSSVQHGDADSVVVTHLELLRHCKAEKGKLAITKLVPIPNLNMIVSLGYDPYASLSDAVGFNQLVRVSGKDPDTRFVDAAWDPEHEEVILLDLKGNIMVWDSRHNKTRASTYAGRNSTALLCVPGFPKATVWVAHRDAIESYVVDRVTSFVEHAGHTARVLALHINEGCIFNSGPSSLAARATAAAATAAAAAAAGTPGSSSAVAAPVGEHHQPDELTGYFLASASADNSIILWTPTMAELKTFKERHSEITCFIALPSLGWVVTGHDNGSLKFWALTRDRTFRFRAHENTVSGICEGFHRMTRGYVEPWHHVATVSFDSCLAIWDIPTEGHTAKCEARLRVTNSELVCVAYDSLNYTYLVGDNNGDVTIWSVDELRPVRALRHLAPGGKRILPAHSEAVTCLALDGNYCFTGGEDERLELWSALTGDYVKDFRMSLPSLGPAMTAAAAVNASGTVPSGSFSGFAGSSTAAGVADGAAPAFGSFGSLPSTAARGGGLQAATAAVPPAAAQGRPASDHVALGEIQAFVVIPETGNLLACTRSGMLILFSQQTGEALASHQVNREVATIVYNRRSDEILAGLDDGVILRVHMSKLSPISSASGMSAARAATDGNADDPFGEGESRRKVTFR